jgi:hypothetical protein
MEFQDTTELLKGVIRDIQKKKIMTDDPSTPVSIGDVGIMLTAKTGQTWTKHYKKQHGNMSRFFNGHPDVFLVVEDKVMLVPETDRTEGDGEGTEDGGDAATTAEGGESNRFILCLGYAHVHRGQVV